MRLFQQVFTSAIKLFFLCLTLAIAQANAATITVKSSADAGGTCPGATCTLRQAIATAADGDTINFDMTSVTSPITLASTLTINKSLTIQGPGANLLTVSGNNTVTVFTVSSGSYNVMLSGLTISNGGRPNFIFLGGSGIANNSTAVLTVTNCTISGNFAGGAAGGISNNSSGTVNILGSTISNNSSSVVGASSAYGGIYNNQTGTVNITNSSVSGNSAATVGGIYNAGTMNITNSMLSGNTTTSLAGAIYNSGGFGGDIGILNITSSIISGNSAHGGDTFEAGGIYNRGGTVTLTNSTLSSNSSNSSGGGIFNDGFGSALTITGSTLSGNSVSGGTYGNDGGGIYNGFRATLTITSSTLSGNSVSGGSNSLNRGGGIYDDIQSSMVTITSSTISGNSVSGGGNSQNYGGGISTGYGTLQIKNTIIAGNTASTAGPDVSGSVTSQGYNLIGKSDGASGFTNGTNNDQVGTIAAPRDPLLAPLGNNGGPTQTHALLPGSPAIDKGNSFSSTTDQRGLTRPIDNPSIMNATGGDGADIGAFEMQAAPTAASVSIGGRVVTATGRGIRNVRVSLIDASGAAQITLTNAFGYYHFKEVAAGETYILNVSAKRYTFENPTQILNIGEDLLEMNFTALP